MGAMVLLIGLAAWTALELPFTLANGETLQKKPLPATMPGGIAAFDYDGDGRTDLFFPNSGGQPSKLLRNLGGMKFEDATAKAGLTVRGDAFAAAAGDYDGDGRVDLLVCGLKGVQLFRNEGGQFRDVTAAAGIGNKGRWSVGAAWFDMDNDGDLDLFLVNYVKWNPATERTCLVNGKPDFCHPRHYEPEANALFRNNGDGTFTDVSDASGIAAHKGKGMGVAVADFDGDGFADLFVTNDRVFNFLFRNRGDGTFLEAAFEAGVAVPRDGNPPSAMGVDAQDYDNDGAPDFVYTALRDETFPLYRNRGKEFDEATARSGLAVLTRQMAGWGVVFADLDNDGWKDIAAARSDALSPTGGHGAAAKEPPSWFRSTADGKFMLGGGWESALAAMHRGLITADLDGDGCLDVVLTALNAPARILRNPCAERSNWVAVHARGTAARVRVGKQWRETRSTSLGYASSYAGPHHFGLGAEAETEVEVIWTNGRRKTLRTPANRTVTIDP
mgnify:CR=1 FL=1